VNFIAQVFHSWSKNVVKISQFYWDCCLTCKSNRWTCESWGIYIEKLRAPDHPFNLKFHCRATFSFPQRLYNSVAMQPSRLQRRAGSLCSISPCATVHKSGSSKQRPSGRNNSKTRERGTHGKPRRPSHARRQTTRVREHRERERSRKELLQPHQWKSIRTLSPSRKGTKQCLQSEFSIKWKINLILFTTLWLISTLNKNKHTGNFTFALI
jgi:hypothetical protein